MKVRMELIYEGHTYIGDWTEVTDEQHAQMLDQLTQVAKSPNYLSLQSSGATVILPAEAAARAVWIVRKEAGEERT